MRLIDMVDNTGIHKGVVTLPALLSLPMDFDLGGAPLSDVVEEVGSLLVNHQGGNQSLRRWKRQVEEKLKTVKNMAELRLLVTKFRLLDDTSMTSSKGGNKKG